MNQPRIVEPFLILKTRRWAFSVSVFPVQCVKLANLPFFSFLSSSVCKLYKVKKVFFVVPACH